MEDCKYYCVDCDWYYKPSEVEEQDDGISDVICPHCGQPLQGEPDNG